MKHVILFSLLISCLITVQAQKKTVAKPASGTATTAAQKTTTAANASATPSAFIATGNPESFKKLAADVRSQYDAGKLDDSRFALQQMLTELDMIIGKEVLKVLPSSLQNKAAVVKTDNVSGAAGFFGVVISREYGSENNSSDNAENRNIQVEIISNSPLIASINALLSLPIIGNTGDSKVVKIAGYKALISKTGDDDGQPAYDLQMPLGSSLITLKAPGCTQEQIAQMANSLPVQEIAKMLQ